MSMTINLDSSSLAALLNDIQEDLSTAARPAAQAAAEVLYQEVKRNVASIGKKTGNLEKSIYQVFSQDHSTKDSATYHISWNAKKAPHGGLVEFGHIQRYQVIIGSNGRFYTAVRKEMQGKPKPKRRASQAEKDAYYVMLPTPKQVAAKSFIRAAQVTFPQALDAAQAELVKRINAK